MIGSALPVRRETIETAAVVTRVAPSFIRFGHFEHFAHHDQHAALRVLADFVIDHHYPACREAAQPYAALLAAVAHRTALLLAQWQAVGFCHGVMNTDNLSILGLTIDYGPFGFLDGFDPGARLQSLRPPGPLRLRAPAQRRVLEPARAGAGAAAADGWRPTGRRGDDRAGAGALEPYRETFPQALAERLRAKLGLAHDAGRRHRPGRRLLRLLASERVDHTIAWRRLADFRRQARPTAVRDLFVDRAAFDAWALRYAQRLAAEGSHDAERPRG